VNSVTESLAHFIVSHPDPDIPPPVRVRVHARYARLVALACAGADELEPPIMARTLLALSDACEVGLLGLPGLLGVCEAPVVTALAMDSAARTAGADLNAWPEGPVLAAAMAAAELRAQTLSACLDAVAIGAEVGLRVEAALQPALSNAGWRRFAVASRLGAAAAAGRLLGLDRDQLVTALGLAATQIAARASSTVSLSWARAAGDGVEAALLAQAGMTGPAAPLEGRRGLAQVLATTDLAGADTLHDLGRRWLVLELLPNPDDSPQTTATAALRAAQAFGDDQPWTSLHRACLSAGGA